jgi:arsenate reductase-like glutaredoxin family protein
MEVQIFGTRKSPDTRHAMRFFAERRVKTHFVDLHERPASAGELRRFVQKFGIAAIVDTASKRYGELGLRAANYGEDRWLDILVSEPLLLRVPLARFGQKLAVGRDEATWREWTGR